MPFYYDGLCADHLRTWEAAKEEGGGEPEPCVVFPTKQKQSTLNIPQMDGAQ